MEEHNEELYKEFYKLIEDSPLGQLLSKISAMHDEALKHELTIDSYRDNLIRTITIMLDKMASDFHVDETSEVLAKQGMARLELDVLAKLAAKKLRELQAFTKDTDMNLLSSWMEHVEQYFNDNEV
jgi:hypothetical protein